MNGQWTVKQDADGRYCVARGTAAWEERLGRTFYSRFIATAVAQAMNAEDASENGCSGDFWPA